MKSRPVVIVGDVINDLIVRPKTPVQVGTDTPSEITRSPGGSGANQAAWLACLQTPVRFAGRVGAADASYHRDALERLGVATHLVEDASLPTGTIVVLVAADGERSMFTDRGASLNLQAADLPVELLEGAALLHVSGYQLFAHSTRTAVAPLWAAARTAGMQISVDPASVGNLREVGRDAFFEWTSGAELVFPNIDEARFLAKASDREEVVAALLGRYPVVALKLGAAGALVATAAGRRVSVSPEPAEVRDSTGAGDAFCAGFLSRWVLGAGLEECAATAVDAAARAVGIVGPGQPSADHPHPAVGAARAIHLFEATAASARHRWTRWPRAGASWSCRRTS